MDHKPDLKETVKAFWEEIMNQLDREFDGDYEGLKEKWLEIHEVYLATVNACLARWAESRAAGLAGEAQPDAITADQVVLEVTDRATGILFRRVLPLDYLETDNGIRLAGETVDGVATHLAFLSETGVSRMKDILGQGLDAPRCQ